MYLFSEDYYNTSKFISALESSGVKRLVLFGAGGWGEVLLEELCRRHVELPIVFSDNDPSKYALELKGRLITSPENLDPQLDMVVITSISAGDSISAQLEDLGFIRDLNYFEVMRNLDFREQIGSIDSLLNRVGKFTDLDILHIGPGGNLGVELLLGALGARSVHSVEYNSFNLIYPDVTRDRSFYEGLAEAIVSRWDVDLFEQRLLYRKNGKLYVNQKKIVLHYPCSVCDMPFQDESFDLVLHGCVFEHVSDPKAGYDEIYRALRGGGVTMGSVGPVDHRSCGSIEEYHPLKFLEYSRKEWNRIVANINFHNRVTTPEHLDMINNAGFTITEFNIARKMEISDQIWKSFHSDFRKYDKEQLGILLFNFRAIKGH